MRTEEQVPSVSGTYALCLAIDAATVCAVGRLGTARFDAGTYVYVGSAFGSGGLRARVRRHLRESDTRHWHVDYLRTVADVCGFCYAATDVRLECRWSQTLAARSDAYVPLAGFGASDCEAGCEAHLVRLPLGTRPAHVCERLARETDTAAVVTVDFGIA